MANTIALWDHSFGAVHDSFSCHACDVDELSKLTQQTFYDLYNVEDPYQDIVDNLVRGDAKYDKDLPETGDLDITEVLTSKYFFS